MFHWSLILSPPKRGVVRLLERPWDSQISVVPQPLEQSSPGPGPSTPTALPSHPFGSTLHLPVISESSAGSQFDLQKHYTHLQMDF